MADLEEIKNRLDIADVLQQYLRLDKAGANWKARCPFHNEKTPSFMVSQDKQIWHCFGCGEGGDIFSFVMKIEGIEFKEALRILAERAGVKLEYSKEYKETKDKKDALYEINEWAAKFFEAQLHANTSTSKKVLDYLLNRGLKIDTVKNFRLGYAPKDWHSLQSFLNSKGYSDGNIEEAGLLIKSQNTNHKSQSINFGNYHDRFRGRVMFPIMDIQSRAVGFTGRVFEPLFAKEELENQGKYVNSPETAIYNKSNILYGLDKAKVSLRRNDLCILVEGNMDLIMSHQEGADNAVAVSGTALTESQIKIIKRYTENLAMAFDSDEAGNIATKRSIDLAIQGGANVKIVDIKGGKDPADILKEAGGVESWKEMIDKSKGVMEFYFSDAFSKFKPDSAENKREITKMLLPVIKKIQNKVEQHHWLHILADGLGTKEEFLVEALNSIKVRKINKEIIGDNNSVAEDQLGENLLGLAIKYYESRYNDVGLPHELFFTDKKVAKLYGELLWVIKQKAKIQDFYDRLSPEEKDYIRRLVFVVEKKWPTYESKEGESDILAIEEDIKFLLKKIEFRKIKRDLNNLSQDIKRAEKESDSAAIELLKEEFKKIAEQLK